MSLGGEGGGRDPKGGRAGRARSLGIWPREGGGARSLGIWPRRGEIAGGGGARNPWDTGVTIFGITIFPV